jgi:hypothetical protein
MSVSLFSTFFYHSSLTSLVSCHLLYNMLIFAFAVFRNNKLFSLVLKYMYRVRMSLEGSTN